MIERRLIPRVRPATDVGGDAGFTLIEMMVALMLLSMVSAGFAYSLQLTLITTQGDVARVQAANLAARELEIVRNEFGATKSAPLTLAAVSYVTNPHPLPDQSAGPLTIDGRPFTVERSTEWLPAGTGASPCDGGSAVTYPSLAVNVRVSWDEKGVTRDVVSNTVLTPPKGTLASIKGFIAAKVQGAAGLGVPNVPVDISGASSQTRVTAADGCAVFAVTVLGNYTVTLDDPGYVSFDGQSATSKAATVSNGTIQIVPFSYDRAATIHLHPQVVPNPDDDYQLPDERPSMVLFNPSLATMGRKTVPGGTDSVSNLWPFPDGYSVWPGICSSNDPAVTGGARPQPAVAAPGASATVDVDFRPVRVTFVNDDDEPIDGRLVTAELVETTACAEKALDLGSTDENGVIRTSLPYGQWILDSGTATTTVLVTSDPETEFPLDVRATP